MTVCQASKWCCRKPTSPSRIKPPPRPASHALHQSANSGGSHGPSSGASGNAVQRQSRYYPSYSRIPTTDQGTAVRFVERAGEVHVSVRTGDAEMAQTLRGGLNDLVNRLEDGGIRTQVWQPGTDTSTSQNDSHHPFADPDGSNGRQYSSGSNSEQESKQHNKPRWVEELEGSIGNPKFQGDDATTMASIASVIGSGANPSTNPTSPAMRPPVHPAPMLWRTSRHSCSSWWRRSRIRIPPQPMDSTAFLSQLAQFSRSNSWSESARTSKNRVLPQPPLRPGRFDDRNLNFT